MRLAPQELLLKQPQCQPDSEAQRFLREAEELIAGNGK
jgi:hypothetical protein